MTKEEVKQVIETWRELAETVHSKYDKILNQDNLLDLSVRDFNDLVEYSRKFIGIMENLFCDFRHLVGMGNLKASDRNILISIFKDITSFRPDARRIMSITDIKNMGFTPSACTYSLKLNPSIKLTSTPRPGQTYVTDPENPTISLGKSTQVKSESEIDHEMLGYLTDVEIKKVSETDIYLTVKSDKVRSLRAILNRASTGLIGDPDFNIDNFIHKLNSGKAYGFDVMKSNDKYTIDVRALPSAVYIYSYILFLEKYVSTLR